MEIIKRADPTGQLCFQRGADYLVENERKRQDERARHKNNRGDAQSGGTSGEDI